MSKITVRNLPLKATEYLYVIYRVVDGVNWYYGATNNLRNASCILHEVGKEAMITESTNVN